MLVSSDPYISTIRKKQTKKSKPLAEEVLHLLKSEEKEPEKVEDIEQPEEMESSDESTDGERYTGSEESDSSDD